MDISEYDDEDTTPLVTLRVADLALSGLFIALGIFLALDNYRTGIGWTPSGPESGVFPFLLSLMMIGAGIAAFVTAMKVPNAGRSFVTRAEAPRLARILVPSIVFVAAIPWIGVYVAGFAMITGFMRAIGRFGWALSVGLGAGVMLALFWVFEIQFQVFLPTGPLEAWLGF